jgi:hypothetical protein
MFKAFMVTRPPTVHEEEEQNAWDDFLGGRFFQTENEEAILWTIQMTYTKCMNSPDATKWVEADTLRK